MTKTIFILIVGFIIEAVAACPVSRFFNNHVICVGRLYTWLVNVYNAVKHKKLFAFQALLANESVRQIL